MTPLQILQAFAAKWRLRITSSTGGRHNRGSLHYQGRAIDVGVENVTAEVIADARRNGINVRDERTRPPGQKEWDGAHYHLSYTGDGGTFMRGTVAKDVPYQVLGKTTRAQDKARIALNKKVDPRKRKMIVLLIAAVLLFAAILNYK